MILSYSKKHASKFALLAVCALFGGVLEITAPFLVGNAIDNIVSRGNVNFRQILHILPVLVAFYLFNAFFTYIASYMANKISNCIVRDLRKDAFSKLASLPLSYYDRTAHGDIISRFTNDCDSIADGLIQGIFHLFTGLITIIGSLYFMLRLSPIVTLAVLLVTSITFGVAYFVTKISNENFKKQQILVGQLNGMAEELIAGARTIRAFSYEERAAKKFDEVNRNLYYVGQKAQFTSSLTNPTTRFVNYLAQISVGVVGGILAGLTPGKISSFILYGTLFSKPFNELTGVATQIMTAYAGARRINELLYSNPEKPDGKNAVRLSGCKGEVSIENVCFSYVPEKKLISGFNLAVPPGTRVAIVGPTGAGKTTFVNLLMRFYDIDGGAIFVDGINIDNIKKDSLRLNYGMVLQDSWLFEGTIRDNIAYGRPDATLDEIINASKSAYAHNFIKHLPHGYDTLISEDGGNLSQGQKQLLTIARVMLIDPAMLILDEATSSVDTLTEIKIQKAFTGMMTNKTSFIIAHRLSTIRESDIIIVMNNGQIVEQGSHLELLKRNGFYARLYSSQFES
jgi:ATP-binding cassette subfamily B protein/subfamily B ATP-binding cassette protein MsbA